MRLEDDGALWVEVPKTGAVRRQKNLGKARADQARLASVRRHLGEHRSSARLNRGRTTFGTCGKLAPER